MGLTSFAKRTLIFQATLFDDGIGVALMVGRLNEGALTRLQLVKLILFGSWGRQRSGKRTPIPNTPAFFVDGDKEIDLVVVGLDFQAGLFCLGELGLFFELAFEFALTLLGSALLPAGCCVEGSKV